MSSQDRLVSSSTHLFKQTRLLAEQEGVGYLSDAELFAMILGRGDKSHSALSLAQKLTSEPHSLSILARLRPRGLSLRTGLTRAQAARISAAFEMGRRAHRDAIRLPPGVPLTKERVAAWALPRLTELEHEEVWVLCVDARATLSATFQVGRGGVHGCALLPRDILTPVVREGAAGFVLVHNHPSGDPTPSPEDLELTRNVFQAAATISVPLLDHVVVARGGAESFVDRGLM